MRRENVSWSKTRKLPLGSDSALQLEQMKEESVVIVDQNATVNNGLNLAHTARHVAGGSVGVNGRTGSASASAIGTHD